MATKITITEYDPRWPELFEAEKQRLDAALGSHVQDVQHIGSTAVPGLAAKPIIDILIGVDSLETADVRCVPVIVALGYEYVRDVAIEAPSRYFRKADSDGVRTHHIHLMEVSCEAWSDHLAFRDHLRSHPDARTAYESLKRELASREWRSGMEYAAAKTPFIRALVRKLPPK